MLSPRVTVRPASMAIALIATSGVGVRELMEAFVLLRVPCELTALLITCMAALCQRSSFSGETFERTLRSMSSELAGCRLC